MPADPKLNEPALLKSLRDPDALIAPEGARFLCNLVLLAAYDRKVDREYFAEVLSTCHDIHVTMADLETAGKMMSVLAKFPDAPETPGPLMVETDKLCKTWARLRHKLADQFDLVTQCPTLSDKIS